MEKIKKKLKEQILNTYADLDRYEPGSKERDACLNELKALIETLNQLENSDFNKELNKNKFNEEKEINKKRLVFDVGTFAIICGLRIVTWISGLNYESEGSFTFKSNQEMNRFLNDKLKIK